MPPSLSDYQAAAKAQYEPQLQADITSSKATTAASVANLESTKGQIQTDYNSAIQNLQNSIQDQTGRIGQLYTSRLLGNISGLQGNDMGQMYSRANQQQATIESTRANKLSNIATQETNLQNQELANESSLQSKYQGLEAGAASQGYAAALKDYEDQQYRNAELSLSQQRLALEYQNAANSAANSTASQYKATAKSGNNGFAYSGPNGQALNLGQYAKAISSNGAQALQVIRNQLQASNTSTDKAALVYFNSQMQKYNGNFNQVVGAISNKKEFASLFNGM